MEKMYCIPVTTNGNGTVLEYRVSYRKKDMRRTFCRKNDTYIVNPEKLIAAVGECGVKIKGNRIIMTNAETARKFSDLIL